MTTTDDVRGLADITTMTPNERRINAIVCDLIDRLDREVAYLEEEVKQTKRDMDALSVEVDLLLGDDDVPSKPVSKGKAR